MRTRIIRKGYKSEIRNGGHDGQRKRTEKLKNGKLQKDTKDSQKKKKWDREVRQREERSATHRGKQRIRKDEEKKENRLTGD